ncbi:hypothetical protein [Cryptosporangium aurantiacum]|uniref:Uncharacterized protein n=1 Tax=Cryptosporangium aurantiacum TaxID=134849 RepID=A0A1M7RGC4_9ACTN|nr:hypothetical protein [Cryptosporangium aurantiacum]SHN45317.1 hypothetical protein SAMN05443668_111250 [Cryptosporangium aurantiacum]
MRWRARVKQLLLVGIGTAIGFNGVAVAVAPGRMQTAYGIDDPTPDLTVLLRHRAVMLALIGAVVVVSAWRPPLRPTARVVAAVSMTSFVLFAFGTGVNAAQQRVAIADMVLLVALATATALPDEPRPAARP